MKCSDIEKQLELFIPKGLAQTDKKENTGLIVGRSDKNVSTIIVAYRIDQETIDYAVSAQADMIIRAAFYCSCCAMILHVTRQEAVLINAREAVLTGLPQD
jgi:hypothetical protein